MRPVLSRLSSAQSVIALLALPGAALAHGGHGSGDIHWHATDVVGLLIVGGLAAYAIWRSRGGK